MAHGQVTKRGRQSSVWQGLGLLLVILAGTAVRAEDTPRRHEGRGFVFGGTLMGGQMRFSGAEGLAVAVGDVTDYQAYSSFGVIAVTETRSARVTSKDNPPANADRVAAIPAQQSAAGLSMNAGWAFSRQVSVLADFQIMSGTTNEGFEQSTVGLLVRFSPASRFWVEAGPAYGDLQYHYKSATVSRVLAEATTLTEAGAISGGGGLVAAGVSVVRKPKWSLDLHARYSRIFYEGFRGSNLCFGLTASKRPS